MIAHVQQMLTITAWLLASAWLVVVGRDAWLWGVAGFVGIPFGYAVVLASQFVALGFVSQRDPVRPPGLVRIWKAWVWETVCDARVFYWLQPFRWRAWKDRLEVAPERQAQRGVVFIHGFICNRGFWNPWLEKLSEQRCVFVALNLEPVFASIDDYAPQLDAAVEKVTRATGQAPLLVCHSMGGLVARAWLRAANEDDRVHHIVTIGSPHHGTWLGRFSHVINGQQMQQSSAWLLQLERDEPAQRRARFTCFYSDSDNIVFPASAATLNEANNRLVKGVGHVALAFDRNVMDESLSLLA